MMDRNPARCQGENPSRIWFQCKIARVLWVIRSQISLAKVLKLRSQNEVIEWDFSISESSLKTAPRLKKVATRTNLFYQTKLKAVLYWAITFCSACHQIGRSDYSTSAPFKMQIVASKAYFFRLFNQHFYSWHHIIHEFASGCKYYYIVVNAWKLGNLLLHNCCCSFLKRKHGKIQNNHSCENVLILHQFNKRCC